MEPASCRSDHDVLGDHDRIRGGRDQAAVAADDTALVEDAVINLGAFLNLRVLHDDRILHHSAPGDLDAAEEDGVDDGAFDDAAVADQGVGSLAFAIVAGRHIVADLGVDRLIDREQLYPSSIFRSINE